MSLHVSIHILVSKPTRCLFGWVLSYWISTFGANLLVGVIKMHRNWMEVIQDSLGPGCHKPMRIYYVIITNWYNSVTQLLYSSYLLHQLPIPDTNLKNELLNSLLITYQHSKYPFFIKSISIQRAMIIQPTEW